ncbi:MAG TPA: cytochrome c oxidase subunit II [Candidatus Nanoarchaeia archaeon]|nr:cytochrome c oxidase subunit II [Candidatus Nanoarchaeia archaeon]
MKKKRYTYKYFFTVAVALMLLIVAGCSKQTSQEKQQTEQQAAQSSPSKTSSQPSATTEEPASPAVASTTPTAAPTTTVSVKEFTITAKQWEFIPNTIEVNKGDDVVLKLTSIDVTHGFSLPDFNVEEQLMPNKETVIKFKADKTGTFDFRCSVFCGAGHGGMTGKLVVKE